MNETHEDFNDPQDPYFDGYDSDKDKEFIPDFDSESDESLSSYYEHVESTTTIINNELEDLKIFCNEFNIYFHKPRKDRCDLCEGVKIKKQEELITEHEVERYEKHKKEVEKMREERRKDKDEKKVVLCFDLENVLTCPKAAIKNFFYKSKLNVYNMTAHLSIDKKVYCAIWSEVLQGRDGNDMASAINKILCTVLLDYPYIEELTLWSDSCVPQNRNSIMSFAIGQLLQKHNKLQKVTMKFSLPGHSAIQDVDAIHSCIEKSLRAIEYYSPVSLLRALKNVRERKPYNLIQMQAVDFMNFQACAGNFNYDAVPFTQVASLELTKTIFQISYKTSFSQNMFITVNLRQKTRKGAATDNIAQVKQSRDKMKLPEKKVQAIKSMYTWMPKVDREYYEAILPKPSTSSSQIKRNKKAVVVKKTLGKRKENGNTMSPEPSTSSTIQRKVVVGNRRCEKRKQAEDGTDKGQELPKKSK